MGLWLKIFSLGLMLSLRLSSPSFAEDVVAVSPVKMMLKENRLEEAVAICRQYEVLSTRDRDDAFACAWVYLRTDRLPLADKILESQKNNGHLPEFQTLRAYRLMLNKKFDEAKKILDGVTLDHKGTAIAVSAQEQLAEMYELQERLPAAAFIYNLIVREDPNRARANWGLGRFYSGQNDSRRAIQFLEKTTKLWPRHLPSRLSLAYIYMAQGKESLPEAFQWLRECYRLNRSDPEVLEQLGLYFEKRAKINEAIKYWQKAVDVKSDLTLANEKLNEYFGQVVQNLFDKGQFEALIEKFEKSKAMLEQPKYLLMRGQAYRNLSQFENAVSDLRAFLKKEPKNVLAMRELGISYLNLKLYDQALAFFAKCTLDEPTNGINHAWLAFGFEEKGDLKRAKDAWLRAVELLSDPEEIARANRKLASIEKRMKKKDEE